jgi:hypothetical protein
MSKDTVVGLLFENLIMEYVSNNIKYATIIKVVHRLWGICIFPQIISEGK